MYKIVSFRYESVIPKNFAWLCRAIFFLPPQSQIRSYGLAVCINNRNLVKLNEKQSRIDMK